MEIKAPAKINIGLNILSKRADGYHNLSTIFYPINDLFDLLIFTSNSNFEFNTNDSSIPNDCSNLVVQAKNLLEEVTNKKINVKIELQKNIPSQAGLGGGSSDAAATLVTLNHLFDLKLTPMELRELALQIGSDVPFFINPTPAIGTSRGEILEPIDFKIDLPILIVTPKINISTKEAFAKIIPNNVIVNYITALKDGNLDFTYVKENFINDFEEYVFNLYPQIAEIKKRMYKCGAVFASLTGSGSSIYGIFTEVNIANELTKEFKNHFCFLSTHRH